jgi:hypothetical protein
VRANAGIVAVSGKQLAQPVQASFTTVDHLAPAVIHIDPVGGAVLDSSLSFLKRR